MVDRVGQRLGNYTIVRKLGEGGFAEVYLGEHIHLDIYAAIKILHTQLLGGDIDTFRKEARTVAHLIHPHIVRVLDFGIEGNTPFLVMDYASNGTLRQHHARGTRLPLPIVVEYVSQIASGLQYAHDKKLIHRDVKPENMLIGPDDDILLSDFGIALVTQSSRYQGTLEMAGTMAYMSPEQIQGKPRPASDQYALGIVIYEWLTGDRPFHGSLTEIVAQHLAMTPPPLREKLPTIPQAVEDVLMTALAKDPHVRFDSIQTFAEELKHASEEQSSSTVAMLSQTDVKIPLPFPTNAPIISNTVPPYSPTLSIFSPPSAGKESKILPTMPQVNTTPSMRPSMSFLPPRKRRSVRKLILAGLALLILLLGGFGIYYPITLHNAALIQQATMTAVAPITATVRVQATNVASIPAYTTAVANNGIMFGFDAQHTHYNPYERILSPANVSRLVLDWTATTGNHIVSSPAVANGVVYVGSYDHKLYAFDAISGVTLWTVTTGGAIGLSSPAVASSIVYVGSTNGELYAFNAASGVTLWTAATGNDAINSSPVVVNGVVYVGTTNGELYAFNAASGVALWTATTGNYVIDSSPVVANGVVYVGTWREVYVGSEDGKLYAFNAKSGVMLWNADIGDAMYSSPAVANGIVYIGSENGNFYAFNARSGVTLWYAFAGIHIDSSPAIANGIVYIGSYDNKLYAFDAKNGVILWTTSTDGPIEESSPTVANGIVYVGSHDDKLYAFDTKSGVTLWTATTRYSIDSSPAVANGVIYVGSWDGKLYSFHIPGISPY